MKKWLVAFIIEIVLCGALLGGFYIYKQHYAKEQEQKAIVARQELERKQEEQKKRELEAKAEEENRVQKVKNDIVASCDRIDAEFADWLYENYQEASEVMVAAIGANTYEDKLWHEETGKSISVLRDEYSGVMDSEEIMRENSIYTKESASREYASLSFAGDISFSHHYTPAQNYTNLGINGAFSEGLQQTMKEADIFMLNNEFCYTNSNTPISGKTYTFRAAPELVSRLDEMGVDIVSIANNHTYDYGEQGIIDTMNTLRDAGVPYVGAGVNLEDAKNNIVYFVINGMKIAYIAATQVERDLPILTQPATETSAGVIRCFEPELVCEMIEVAEANSDFVIVYPHWGTELVKEIQADQQALAYAFIDAGADAIVGGHPHCLQGIEYYNGVPIFYSMSNFSFSSKVKNSCVLNLQVTMDGIESARYLPCRESNGMTYQCDKGATDYTEIIGILNRYSVNASIDEDGYVTEVDVTLEN